MTYFQGILPVVFRLCVTGDYNEKLTWDEFVEPIKSLKAIDEIKNDLAKEYDLVKILNSRAYYIDLNKRMIIYSAESNAFGLEKQITLAVLFLGMNIIIQFNINYFSSKSTEYFKDVYTIVNTFKFDAGYEYK